MGIPDFEAVKWYNEFAYSLRARIRNREGAVWPGLGSFVAYVRAGMININKSTRIRLMNKSIVWTAIHSVDQQQFIG